MRVRFILRLKKTLVTETASWSQSDLPPRHFPVSPKTRKITGDWRWRAGRASAGSRTFVATVLSSPKRANRKATLMEVFDNGSASVIARFEDHGSHPGLHVHSHCIRSGLEMGGTSMDDLGRVPDVSSPHRRIARWTDDDFWAAALRFFRIDGSFVGMQGTLDGI